NLSGEENNCIKCHMELEDELKAPAILFENDIHREYGLKCNDCHGGNPSVEDIDLAKDKTFKGAPPRNQIPEFCGSCHSNPNYMRKYNPSLRVDQLSLYWTSQHGKLLRKGDTKVAVCSDCHGVHGIRKAINPKSKTFPWNIPSTCGNCHSNKELMKEYGIPANQEKDYRESVHAKALYEKKDLSAPVCNDCHGNHGALPPELTSIAYVCRQCHLSSSELFSSSPHKTAFDELGLSECEACHGNHKILPPTDEMLGIGEKAVCIKCHEVDSKPYNIAKLLKQKLNNYLNRIDLAETLLDKAQKSGVEVSEPRFKLREVNTILIQVRDLIHGLNIKEIEEKLKNGNKLLDEIIEAGNSALKEVKFRRKGLIITLIFIFILAIALLLKIRQISKK
ncbi:cytochrome c3 family protein, partial [Candidatus Aminicenantes bacterium AC-335-G13]|nr:cytochrome c3 family protein [Candidatus Aminicenantes bacterium AC-335-G13]